MIDTSGSDPISPYLSMEYEQTVQTLRNWDTLFFGAFSSILISGAIGLGVSMSEANTYQHWPKILLGVATSLYVLVCTYFIYSRFVALPKISVIKEIEQRLNLVGAYRKTQDTGNKLFRVAILPFFTLSYATTVGLIFYFGL